jgi:hypothetical protein
MAGEPEQTSIVTPTLTKTFNHRIEAALWLSDTEWIGTAHVRMNANTAQEIGQRRKSPQRPPRPGLGRGRVQLAANRAFVCGDVITTADAAQTAFVRKLLILGRRLEPHDYRTVRRALRLMATPIGRGGGRGRAMRWRLSGAEQPSANHD